LTDVSEQPICPIFKGQEFQEELELGVVSDITKRQIIKDILITLTILIVSKSRENLVSYREVK